MRKHRDFVLILDEPQCLDQPGRDDDFQLRQLRGDAIPQRHGHRVAFDGQPAHARTAEGLEHRLEHVHAGPTDIQIDPRALLAELGRVARIAQHHVAVTSHEQVAVIAGEAGQIGDVGKARDQKGVGPGLFQPSAEFIASLCVSGHGSSPGEDPIGPRKGGRRKGEGGGANGAGGVSLRIGGRKGEKAPGLRPGGQRGLSPRSGSAAEGRRERFPPCRTVAIMEIWTATTLNSLPGRCFMANFPSSSSSAGLARLTIADVGEAQIDLDRDRRCGFPEVVFAEGKTVAAMEKIFQAQIAHGSDVLATRMAPEQAAELLTKFPQARYNPVGRTFRIPPQARGGASDGRTPQLGRVVIVTAGTSDLPVAEEARETALWTGAAVEMVQDVGVAGPHRLTANLPLLEAGRRHRRRGRHGRGAAQRGGRIRVCPVIAVPTSVGYGASFGGIAALLGMLNSCAANVSVVNIDAGFKGGYVAGLIAQESRTARGNTSD